MTKKLHWVLVIYLLGTSQLLMAQGKASEYDYIYQIQVTITNQQTPLSRWNKLRDLGEFHKYSVAMEAEELPGKKRILLGKYIGKSTANKILAEVKKRGYKSAKIISDGGFALGHSTGKHVKHALQLGAFNSLKLVNAKKYPQSEREESLYIQYKGGAYKIFRGLYDGHNMEDVKKRIIPWFKKKGFSAFIQKFR